ISFWPFTFRKFTFTPAVLFTAAEACMRMVALFVLLLLLSLSRERTCTRDRNGKAATACQNSEVPLLV
ncbi:unnamed protein product, partial [Ectocarpus sp. 12 AP-2014]